MGAAVRYDWRAVQEAIDAGHGFVECRRRFGFSHTAWIKAIRTSKISVPEALFVDRRRKHDWAAVQRYYDEGHSYRECRAKFGFESMSWYKARQRGEIISRAVIRPIDIVLRESKSRAYVKARLLRAGIIENRCDECGLNEWRGRALTIQIDHINGIGTDNRLENLRMLCPNCHSQTETFGTRNWKIDRSRVV